MDRLEAVVANPQGQLTEIEGGYTFFWSGHSNDKQRKAGVGFAIKDHLVKKLNSILGRRSE